MELHQRGIQEMSFSSSPQPVPFVLPDTPFSQRKRTPLRARYLPTSPAKSCPPVSRLFTPKQQKGPLLVSFKSERKSTELSSPYYNSHLSVSYFEQCFEVLDKLGQGSFGEVFKVRSHEDGKLYAVKKSRQRFRGQWDRRQKLREVEKHENLPPQRNCVRFHKAWEERDCLYIQTELCSESLSEYADHRGRVPERRVWAILVDLLRGLKHLHDNNLCHFDIKPANIFLGGDGSTCKLGDFGLCVTMDHGDLPAMEGDSKYMAPELLREGFGKPADVFSLGISVLELACDLELPTDGPNWQLLRRSQLPQDFIKDLSPTLVDLLSRMMHPDPAERPSVDQVLAERSVRWEALRTNLTCVCRVVTTGVMSVVRGVLALVTLILAIFSGTRSSKPSSATPLMVVTPVATNRHHRQRQLNNDSFSDDEGPQSSGDREASKFNTSWIQNSPVRYPSALYSGPPIPLDYGDSSDNQSPNKTSRHSPFPRVSLNQSGLFSSSQDSSFNRTPRSKSMLNESLSESLNSSRSSKLGIEPKNLMEAFLDSGD
ncbi:membrane-associated tyrosine- and threonine-specific cdc2-inhibitory kinase-like [Halichondria panicea]|uniref:membrane-associated tyrosine- and threonine-specific cdc2-inhibitory kinase-like n=1 Tax=Halichondria panicea TaxID=6063 RepID=UPI00312BC821